MNFPNFSIISLRYRKSTRIGLPAYVGSYSGYNLVLILSKNHVTPPATGQPNQGNANFSDILLPYDVKEKYIGIEYVAGNAWVVSQNIQIDFSMIFGLNYRFNAKSSAASSDLSNQIDYGVPYMSGPKFMPVSSKDYTITNENEIFDRVSATVMPKLKVSYLF